MHKVLRWLRTGTHSVIVRLMADEPRPLQWWILSPDDRDGDLRDLLAAIEKRDWAVFAGGELPAEVPPVALHIANSADGRKVCTALIVGLNEAYPLGNNEFGAPTEVTSRALRAVPIAELISRAVHDERAPDHHAGFRRMVLDRMPDTSGVRRAPGPKGHPDEHFEMVAAVYRAALTAAPRRPMSWLADQFPEVDRSTVARWLQRARDKGYLGEAQPGRAGERPAGDDDGRKTGPGKVDRT